MKAIWESASHRLVPVAVGVLTLLLVVLATLQYRWLDQVRQAERERLSAGATRHAEDFARDFDRQLAQAWAWLLVDPDTLREGSFDSWAQRRDQWRTLARFPELVKDVYLIERRERQPALLRFDPATRGFHEAEWPSAFATLREHAAVLFAADPPEGLRAWRESIDPVDEATLSFVVAIPELAPPASEQRRERRATRLAGFTLIQFDPAVIREQVLPALIQRHFEIGHEPAFSVSVVKARSGARLAGDTPETDAPPDATAGLFALRLEEAGADLSQAFAMTRSRRQGAEAARVSRTPPRRPRSPRGPGADTPGHWLALVRHRGGPIDDVVVRTQTRNLAIGFSILALLGASGLLLVAAAQRSRSLAQQQMAFVAGVSHELRTPVAVIASSAANLADGVVRDPEQIKRYGSVIQKEARRLGEMVSQVLEFATPETPAPRQPVDLAQVVQEALLAVEPERLAAGMQLKIEMEPEARTALGDAAALRRAIENLLANAVKYGRPHTPIEVTVRSAGGEVRVSVADHGMGVPEAERERIFEPFYRGQEAVAAQIRGNGLGLNLVRRIASGHGGQVTLESVHGQGSRFTLCLPAPVAALEPAQEDDQHSDHRVPETNPSR